MEGIRIGTYLQSPLTGYRSGPYEFHPEIWSFEDVGEDDGSPVSASSSEGEEDGDLNADWESVSYLT